MERYQTLLTPKHYSPLMDVRETERGIQFIKGEFQKHLAAALNLNRVSAPIAVLGRTGINDTLNGVEKPVDFMIRNMDEKGEIVQSLAKWKRQALAEYGFQDGEGLYTDMNAIRPEENLDNLHSIYVDQWDWERVIRPGDRSMEFLRRIVDAIYAVLRDMEQTVCRMFPKTGPCLLPDRIFFVHSEELEDRFPDLLPWEREDAICREKGSVFVAGIGAPLKNGMPHDGRAADYDDWITEGPDGKKGLNGDILVWYPVLERAFELSSMGIRVDRHSLMKQLDLRGESHKLRLDFHQRLMKDRLPLTIGGGIGQSRLCMFYLRKAHIGEVQAGIWPDEMRQKCRKSNIFLL
ncbi:aspartate--ammonia ligase [bacterium]|nr:aspartate--ammonia ligase [bacterium]